MIFKLSSGQQRYQRGIKQISIKIAGRSKLE